MEKEILSVSEVAELLGSTEGSIRKMVQRCQLPYYKPFGKLLFKRSEIMEIIEAAHVPSAAQIVNNSIYGR